MTATALDLLEIRLPIVQAPMAGTATPELAAAVSNAGGLGSLGLGSSSPTAARTAIHQYRALSNRPLNVNFFCHDNPGVTPSRDQAWLEYLAPWFHEFTAQLPDQLEDPETSFNHNRAMHDMLLEECPEIVSFHFGLPPGSILERLKSAGIILMATATSLEEARQIERAGIDIVIAQGWEAGGHRGIFDQHADDGQLSTVTLLNQLRQHCRLPIIAAGGIMNGQTIATMLQLGACAAQLGTAFILCPESAASPAYRKALNSPAAQYTRHTAAISGRPARGIMARVHRELDTPGRPPLPDYPVCYQATKALQAAASQQNHFEFGSHWAGQGAPLARPMPAAELVKTLANEIASVMAD